MKILLVEDNLAVRECLRLQLEILGHEVWEAGTLKDMDLMMTDGPVSLAPPCGLIIDGHFPALTGRLPEKFGLSLCRLARKGGHPTVLYTGDEALLDEAKTLGIPAVAKPGKIAEIMAFLEAREKGAEE